MNDEKSPDSTLSVGFLQFAPVFGSPRENLSVIEDALGDSVADLMVLPELPFTGYSFRDRDQLLALAEEPEDSSSVTGLVDLCSRNGMAIVTGFAERDGERVYNSALLIDSSGIRGRYRKLHLFDREKDYFDPGDLPLSTFPFRGFRIGMMVCFDWIFPEVARTLALKGADLICHPANLVLDHCQRAMMVRCTENMIYAVTANRTGTESSDRGDLSFTGRSQIVAPAGQLLCSAGEVEQKVCLSEIRRSMSRNKFITDRNSVLDDRRPDYYF